MRKQFLLSLLVALLTTLSTYAYHFQSGDLYYNITGENTVEVTYQEYWDVSNYQGLTIATIPETVTYNGTTYSVTSIRDFAFEYCSSLTSITIPNSVTSIGRYAFEYCSSLTSITIPNSVTSIGNLAFGGCSALTTMVVESGNTIYDSRENCNAIIETASNTLIAGCQSTIIPNSVTSIGDRAFYNCSSLTSINLPNSVTSIGDYAFNGCTSLTSITLPNSVTSIGSGAFGGCSSLTSIVVESGNTMYDSRENCNAIIETASNTLIAGCQSTIIPNSVTSIGNRAFYYCSSLTSITIPNSVTSIGKYAFYNCSSLTSITLPNSVTSIGSGAFGGCSSLTSITIPNSVTSIGDYAFDDCSSITSITIPNSVTSIGGGAFSGCSSLTSITCLATTPPTCGGKCFTDVPRIPLYVPAESVEAYKAADTWNEFDVQALLSTDATLSSLTYDGMSVPSFDADTLHYTVDLPSETVAVPVVDAVANDAGATLTIHQATTLPGEASVEVLAADKTTRQTYTIYFSKKSTHAYDFQSGDLYYNITSGTTVEVTYQKISNLSNYQGLTTATIPETVNYNGTTYSVTSIGEYAFMYCSSLTSINIPNSVTSIGWSAFANCSSLTSITIPNSVTSIGSSAFNGCSSITSITIPNSVTSIGYEAFSDCSSLTSVTSLSCTPPSCGSNVFYYTPSEKTLVVPGISMDAYKNSSTWKDFTSFEKCLSVFVQSSNSTMGGVAQIEQDVDCDSVAIISATANYGYHFKQWNDGNTDNPRTITLTQDTTFTAEFAPNQYTLTTTTNYAERGTAQGDTIADYLTEIQVSATANYGYHFTQWSDGNTDNPRTISLTKDTNLVAQFDKNQYQCSINCDKDRGNGFVSGNGSVSGDFIVNLFDSYGDGWNGCKLTISDGEHTYDCTINTGSNASYEITDFGLPYTFYWTKGSYPSECSFEVICGDTTIYISSLGSYNTGDVIPILLPNMMPLYYDYLSELELSITSNYGYHFTQWSDGNTDNPRTITLTQDTTFTAEFAPHQYTLTTTAADAERGTAQGDTIADYLSEIQVSATANYGYHFTQWGDGNTDNPRTISLTKDTNVVALFDKNQYTITTSCNAEQGNVSKPRTAKYLDEVTISATANLGYHFKQWNDGNTDNPRTIKLTQDTTFVAEFEMDYSGKCGDDLYWAYSNQEIKISGKGTMYNYTENTMPWTLLRDSIKTVRIGNNATSIGEYAFSNTPKLAELHIGTNVENIGTNAFSGCKRLYDIYCYPTYPPLAVKSSFANYNVHLHIPCEAKEEYYLDEAYSLDEAKEEYSLDLVWGLFQYIECIDSEMGIDDPQVPMENFHQDKIEKIIRNGQVLIIRNGKTYNMMGQRL